MDIEVKKYLQDIVDSIDIIELHLHGVSGLYAYQSDLKTIDAVERRLAVVGEALWKADKIDGALSISDKGKVIALRHILVHDYDLVENETIWVICKKHLPALKAEIKAILE
jgi:uncharacterized protein with HEPN domain